jgi:hypothetical protein
MESTPQDQNPPKKTATLAPMSEEEKQRFLEMRAHHQVSSLPQAAEDAEQREQRQDAED